MLEKLFYTETSWFFTLLRLVLGLVILPHGLQKLCGFFGGYGFSATLNFFKSEGIPYAIGFLVIVAESFGALGLILGLFTRISSFGIALTMIGAAIYVRKNGFFMNWFNQQAGEGFEYHILAIGIAVILMISGGGQLAVDSWISNKIQSN
ncbi:DoxX family protein [Leptospira congkakensis]|uniref:DoxX family protein n=1 Tax=Leptospira congkakensis TaxID=2484932 RepID=A0A4Z1A086_9LEPT|nr:DoxX family protein [Leptospira congkakensis]TGL86477.1 DoxX family protein [Leptospira congkakensis]TGL93977.1 DoxX family protein [Leptospira congkakensis]TGL94617.1 DoxX family protein [Leptospira congkakensis]